MRAGLFAAAPAALLSCALLLVGCAKATQPAGGACKTSDDCSTGLACLADKCIVNNCSSDTTCGAGFICTPAHQCVAQDGPTAPTTLLPAGQSTVVKVLSYPFQVELAGAIVLVNGQSKATGADGTASFPLASTPYDVVVLLPPQRFPSDPTYQRGSVIYMVNGLTRLNPTIRLNQQSPATHDTVSGDLTSGVALPAGLAAFWYDSADAFLFGRTLTAADTSPPYSTSIYRRTGSSAPTGKLTALLMSGATASELNTPSVATTFYTGSASLGLAASEGSVTQNVAMTAVAMSHNVNLTVTLPGQSWGMQSVRWFGVTGGKRVEVATWGVPGDGARPPPGVNSTFKLPIVGGMGIEVRVEAKDTTTDATRALNTEVADTVNTLPISFIEPPALGAPAASGEVSAGTRFGWTPPSNSTSVLRVKLGSGAAPLEFQCVTRGSSCVLPDLSAIGSAWTPASGSGTWFVSATVPFNGTAPTVDEITEPVLLEKNDTLAETYLFDVSRNADSATTPSRSFRIP